MFTCKLNKNKASGNDGILNEFLINCKDILMPCLVSLFNNVFDSGHFPSAWSVGNIVPVFKKGNASDTDNNRGITLVSCIGKLFTSVINERLLTADRNYNVITDAQFGFRKNMSTIDAIFILQSLIQRTIKKKRKLYCCFIDYKKAFDFINRSNLWFKLIQQGIEGKVLRIIRSLYEKVKCCVKYNNTVSEWFDCNAGLFQGEVLSPILFSMYVNDMEMHFLSENCPSLEIQEINIFLLMYADDTVLLAESPEGLQSLLDALYSYSTKWDLTVNTDKTKILVFRNGNRSKVNDKWYYNGEELEVVNEFNYLGFLLSFNGKFGNSQKRIAEQGRKAMYALNNICKKHCFNTVTKLSIFDTYVNSVMSYL